MQARSQLGHVRLHDFDFGRVLVSPVLKQSRGRYADLQFSQSLGLPYRIMAIVSGALVRLHLSATGPNHARPEEPFGCCDTGPIFVLLEKRSRFDTVVGTYSNTFRITPRRKNMISRLGSRIKGSTKVCLTHASQSEILIKSQSSFPVSSIGKCYHSLECLRNQEAFLDLRHHALKSHVR